MTSKMRGLLGLVLCLGLMIGCGKASETPARLSGKVTYDNAPVTGGTLQLHAGDKVFSCSISADGTYSHGLLPTGEMTATVDTEWLKNLKRPEEYKGASSGLKGKFPGGSYQGKAPEPSPPPEGVTATKSEGKYMKIPPKYRDVKTSDLKLTLSAGSQTRDFELKD